MYVRDRVPPGQGSSISDYYDWSVDDKYHGPYQSYSSPGTYTFTCRPIRPGNTHYLGFRAVEDATFSLSSTTSVANIDYTNIIPFYGGYVSNTLPAGGLTKYRIDVPGNAVRWFSSSTNAPSVWLFILPGADQHFRLAATIRLRHKWRGTGLGTVRFFRRLPIGQWQPPAQHGPGFGPKYYQMQSSTNLVNWTALLNHYMPLTITNVENINPIGVPYQYFRLQEE